MTCGKRRDRQMPAYSDYSSTSSAFSSGVSFVDEYGRDHYFLVVARLALSVRRLLRERVASDCVFGVLLWV